MRTEIVELEEPLMIQGGRVTQLKLREPTAIEMYRANVHIETSGNPEAEILFERELVSGVTGIKPPTALDDMPVAVLSDAAARIVALFSEQVDSFLPDNAELEIILEDPITVNGVEYQTVPLRQAKTGEMAKARAYMRNSQGAASRMQYQMSLVSHVSGVALPVIHRFPASAVIRAAVTVEVFTNPGRRTGKI